MAKILIVGSRKNHNAAEFQSACRQIGVALAKRGHVIVAAGCGDEDAETWVLDGANSASTSSKKTKVVPFSPGTPETQDLLQSSNISSRWPNLDLEPPFQTKGSWAVGQAVALLRSDAALLIGGGILTGNVGSLALELNKPYYAVSELGGAAKTIADEDYSKQRMLKVPAELVKPSPASPSFGESIVQATEFFIRRQSVPLQKNLLIFVTCVGILTLFLGFLFRHDPFGVEPMLILTTCLGAIVGVMLSFLVSHVVQHDSISLSTLLGQGSLACCLGVLYAFLALEAGGLYKADYVKWTQPDVDSLAFKLAMIGIAVGALLRPASTQVLEKLKQNL